MLMRSVASTDVAVPAPIRSVPLARPTRAIAGAAPVLVKVDRLFKSFPARRHWRAVLRRPFDRERVEVLRGVSIHVRQGEFFGLLGPNGAGKTTLFKILSTLILPDSGAIDIAGADPLLDPRRVRQVLTPVIADERSLHWRLTGLENLMLFAALYGLEKPQARQGSQALLRTVGLADAAGRMVGTYSSGMRQRLLIARALLSTPAVLLLDEPTRSLDPVSARDFRRFLREEIVERQGCTVILATHDADEAFELCDRLAVLSRGRVVATGTAHELANTVGTVRYRVTVSTDHADHAVMLLSTLDLGDFARECDTGDGWTVLEGVIRGGGSLGADVIRSLILSDIAVAEFARIPISLADVVECAIARGGMA